MMLKHFQVFAIAFLATIQISLPAIKTYGNNFTEIVQHFNYSVASYTIETTDEYFLTLHRMPPKCNDTECSISDHPQVLLLHGLYGSSAHWVLGTPEEVNIDNIQIQPK